eukprot:GHVL01005839.1.p1 GENE.GHVL01005839.1~~GHVL01005839.1.p1  ORF type:complete len:150 (+),score=18.29 GHVL01005839.1:234-683(+)
MNEILKSAICYFYTECVGVKQKHKQLSFYETQFNQDQIRVNKMFDHVKNHGWLMTEKRITIDEIENWLIKKGIVILLVDASTLTLLQDSDLAEHTLDADWWKCSMGLNKDDAADQDFLGHYILLIGQCDRKKHYYLLKPIPSCFQIGNN